MDQSKSSSVFSVRFFLKVHKIVDNFLHRNCMLSLIKSLKLSENKLICRTDVEYTLQKPAEICGKVDRGRDGVGTNQFSYLNYQCQSK